jgi:hypothetical protein
VARASSSSAALGFTLPSISEIEAGAFLEQFAEIEGAGVDDFCNLPQAQRFGVMLSERTNSWVEHPARPPRKNRLDENGLDGARVRPICSLLTS